MAQRRTPHIYTAYQQSVAEGVSGISWRPATRTQRAAMPGNGCRFRASRSAGWHRHLTMWPSVERISATLRQNQQHLLGQHEHVHIWFGALLCSGNSLERFLRQHADREVPGSDDNIRRNRLLQYLDRREFYGMSWAEAEAQAIVRSAPRRNKAPPLRAERVRDIRNQAGKNFSAIPATARATYLTCRYLPLTASGATITCSAIPTSGAAERHAPARRAIGRARAERHSRRRSWPAFRRWSIKS